MSTLTGPRAATTSTAGTAVRPRAGTRRRRGGLFRQRDFRLLWLGETTSQLGSAVTAIAMPLVAATVLHASTFTMGLLAAAVWAPWLFLGLPAGAWVDRMRPRPLMIACDAVAAVLFASVPVAAWAGVLTIAQLLVVALLGGAVSVFFTTAQSVYIPEIVASEDLMEGNAKLSTSESASRVVGPGVGGAMAQAFGAVAGLMADAASFVISLACLLSIRDGAPRSRPGSAPHGEPRTTTLRQEIAAGLRFARRDPYLRVIAAWGAASNLALNAYQALVIVFLVRVVGLAPGAVGGVVSAASLGGIAGALCVTPLARRLGTARALLVFALVPAPFGLLIPLAADGTAGLALAVAGSAILVGGVVGGNVVNGSFRQGYIPAALLGRVTASIRFVLYSTIPVGALLGGTLGTVLGVRPALWIALTGCALAGACLLAGPIRHDRDLPDRPAATVTPEPASAPA